MTALRDPDGKTYGYAKVTRDLTERRAAEARERKLLAAQEARHAAEEALRAKPFGLDELLATVESLKPRA